MSNRVTTRDLKSRVEVGIFDRSTGYNKIPGSFIFSHYLRCRIMSEKTAESDSSKVPGTELVIKCRYSNRLSEESYIRRKDKVFEVIGLENVDGDSHTHIATLRSL